MGRLSHLMGCSLTGLAGAPSPFKNTSNDFPDSSFKALTLASRTISDLGKSLCIEEFSDSDFNI